MYRVFILKFIEIFTKILAESPPISGGPKLTIYNLFILLISRIS